ncbi:hypothetical protein EDD21DRAFT_448378 [Dissophora ornata]|nr:hypothetical protein EDD21DRAFT_448378 [Dissophora ornata]
MNLDTTGLYQTLGVPKSSTHEEITKACRRQALIYHTDKANAAEVPDFETKLRKIAAAFKILGDPRKRSVYDSYGTMGVIMAESDVGEQYVLFPHLIRLFFAVLAFLFLLAILFFCFLSARIDKLIDWDFKIVFIPVWIVDVFLVILPLFLIAVAASGVQYDTKYDDNDIQKQITDAERQRLGQQRRRNFRNFGICKSIMHLFIVCAAIVFQILIVKKANDPSSISTLIVFVPYFAWDGLQFFDHLIAMFDSTRGASFGRRLAAAVSRFTWILTRMAFAALIILRLDEHMAYSWHVVFIPLYLSCLLHIIDSFISAKASTGPSSGSIVCMSVFFSSMSVITLWLPLITMLAAKLDGESYTASHVLIPIFVFLSTAFCCTGCYIPKILSYRSLSTDSNVMEELSAAEAARRNADRQAEEHLLSAERQSQNNSYASTGSSTQLLG